MMNIKAIVCSAVTLRSPSRRLSGPAAADGHGSAGSSRSGSLEGAWQVRITPYVCATGVPLPPAAEFDSLINFAAGGTMTETTSNPRFLPGQRSPGLGYWERNERRSYEIVFQAFVQFTGGQLHAGHAARRAGHRHGGRRSLELHCGRRNSPMSPARRFRRGMHARGRRADAVVGALR